MKNLLRVSVLFALASALFCHAGPPPAQSPFMGHYLGSVYVSTTGPVSNPETDVASIDVEVFADGRFTGTSTVLNISGAVSSLGDLTFNPNESGFTTGKISNNTLSAQANQPNGATTVHWRLAATKAGGSSNLR